MNVFKLKYGPTLKQNVTYVVKRSSVNTIFFTIQYTYIKHILYYTTTFFCWTDMGNNFFAESSKLPKMAKNARNTKPSLLGLI